MSFLYLPWSFAPIDPATGAIPKSILYVGASSTVAGSQDFLWDSATNRMQIGKVSLSGAGIEFGVGGSVKLIQEATGVATIDIVGTRYLRLGLIGGVIGSEMGANSGGGASQALAAGAMALGGSYASGTNSFAAAIANNTVTYGARSLGAIAMGDRNQATFGNATSVGGQLSTAGGGASFVSGSGCSTGFNSFGSVALGNGAANTVAGKFSFAGTYYSSTFGTSQMGMICLSNTTPGAAATVLTSTGGAASTINQLILPDNTAHAFSGIVVARQKSTGGTASAAWSVSGLIRREAGAGTTTLIASTVTVISNVPGWTLALSADTVNGGLSVTATGAAATDIRWHVKLDSSEVTYT